MLSTPRTRRRRLFLVVQRRLASRSLSYSHRHFYRTTLYLPVNPNPFVPVSTIPSSQLHARFLFLVPHPRLVMASLRLPTLEDLSLDGSKLASAVSHERGDVFLLHWLSSAERALDHLPSVSPPPLPAP